MTAKRFRFIATMIITLIFLLGVGISRRLGFADVIQDRARRAGLSAGADLPADA